MKINVLIFSLFVLFISEGRAFEPCSLKVVVDCFSGRPNPFFIIKDSNDLESISQNLLSILADSTSLIDTPVTYQSKLAYRGLKIKNYNVNNIPAEFQLFAGVLEIGNNDTAKYYKDTGSNFEGLLICLGLDIGFIYPDNIVTKDTGVIPINKRASCASSSSIISFINNNTALASGLTMHISGMRMYVSGIKALSTSATVSLFNITGKRMAVRRIQKDLSFDISDLSKGLYCVRLGITTDFLTTKFVIMR